MENFELLLQDLYDMVQDQAPLRSVLEVVATISVQANDVEVSSLILLKKLGESTLNDFLLPAVDPALSFFAGEQESQTMAEERERQAMDRVPRVCD